MSSAMGGRPFLLTCLIALPLILLHVGDVVDLGHFVWAPVIALVTMAIVALAALGKGTKVDG